MNAVFPGWAAELAWMDDGDELLPSAMDGPNVVMNRARLANYLAEFAEDKDVRDLLMLDVVATAAGLPFSSTGLADLVPSLALRPFRIWEYTWLYKNLGLSVGGAKVLDLGGPASHLSIMAALAGCQVTSIDVNPDFVHSAQECARELKLTQLVTRVGDMRNLSDFPDSCFDSVMSCSVLEHLTSQDQELALGEMARVLKPGGVIGITFDFGPAAPGANIYLPPPHEPPPNAAEAVRRYQQGGLVVAGNPFLEDPVPGVLFRDQHVRYTVAALFLAKPPAPKISRPLCQHAGTILNSLTIRQLPSRINKSVARTSEQANVYRREVAPHPSLIELQRLANERLLALQEADKALRSTTLEAEKRERGLHELAAIIAVRDARIREVEQVATERLTALEKTDKALRAITREAEARESALHELSAIITARDARILELERVTAERLTALELTDEALRAITREADTREAGLHELSAIITVRDARILELENVGTERLTALEKTDEALRAITREADARESGLQELTAIIHARDAQILEWERVAVARLTALETTDQALRSVTREAEAREAGLHELTAILHARDARTRQIEGDLNGSLMDSERLRSQLLAVESELSDSRTREDALDKQIVEFKNQSLLKFFISRSRRNRPSRPTS